MKDDDRTAIRSVYSLLITLVLIVSSESVLIVVNELKVLPNCNKSMSTKVEL